MLTASSQLRQKAPRQDGPRPCRRRLYPLAQREKQEAKAALATALPAPEALAFDEVVETLKALRDLPELLSTVDTPTAPRSTKRSVLRSPDAGVGTAEEVKLRAAFQGVELERVGGRLHPRGHGYR
jgi:hypothetical protein